MHVTLEEKVMINLSIPKMSFSQIGLVTMANKRLDRPSTQQLGSLAELGKYGARLTKYTGNDRGRFIQRGGEIVG